MKRSISRIVFGGAVCLCVAGILSLYIIRRSELPRDLFGPDYRWGMGASHPKSEYAPMQFAWEAPPDVKAYWRIRNAARITLLKGEAFLGTVHLPRETIINYLNEKVRRGDVEYVIVFAARGTKWGELFPVLDECRKSEVRVVLLNQYEI